MPLDFNDPALRTAIKEALREWLDQQFATFGRWTMAGLMSAALLGVVYLALTGMGWKK
ncbi:MAG TPA: hypothetical protein VGC09_00570 [Rhodopila sp.]